MEDVQTDVEIADEVTDGSTTSGGEVARVDEPGGVAVAKPIPVAVFEGEYVRKMYGKIPGVTLEMAEGFGRGTYLKVELTLRVRGVRNDEIRSGPDKGELMREHSFALEEARLIGAFHPDESLGGDLGSGQ